MVQRSALTLGGWDARPTRAPRQPCEGEGALPASVPTSLETWAPGSPRTSPRVGTRAHFPPSSLVTFTSSSAGSRPRPGRQLPPEVSSRTVSR